MESSQVYKVHTSGAEELFRRWAGQSDRIPADVVMSAVTSHCNDTFDDPEEIVKNLAASVGAAADGAMTLEVFDRAFQNPSVKEFFAVGLACFVSNYKAGVTYERRQQHLFGQPQALQDQQQSEDNRLHSTPLPRRTPSGAIEDTFTCGPSDALQAPLWAGLDSANDSGIASPGHSPNSDSATDPEILVQMRGRRRSIEDMRSRRSSKIEEMETQSPDKKQQFLEELFNAAKPPNSNCLSASALEAIINDPHIGSRSEIMECFRSMPHSFFQTMFRSLDYDQKGGIDLIGFVNAFSNTFDSDGNYLIPRDAVGSQLRALFEQYKELQAQVSRDTASVTSTEQQLRHDLKQSREKLDNLLCQLQQYNDHMEEQDRERDKLESTLRSLQADYNRSQQSEQKFKKKSWENQEAAREAQNKNTALLEQLTGLQRENEELIAAAAEQNQDLAVLKEAACRLASDREQTRDLFISYMETHPSLPGSARTTPGNSSSKLVPMDGGGQMVAEMRQVNELLISGINYLVGVTEEIAEKGSEIGFAGGLLDDFKESQIDPDWQTLLDETDRKLTKVVAIVKVMANKVLNIRKTTEAEYREQMEELFARQRAYADEVRRLESKERRANDQLMSTGSERDAALAKIQDAFNRTMKAESSLTAAESRVRELELQLSQAEAEAAQAKRRAAMEHLGRPRAPEQEIKTVENPTSKFELSAERKVSGELHAARCMDADIIEELRAQLAQTESKLAASDAAKLATEAALKDARRDYDISLRKIESQRAELLKNLMRIRHAHAAEKCEVEHKKTSGGNATFARLLEEAAIANRETSTKLLQEQEERRQLELALSKTSTDLRLAENRIKALSSTKFQENATQAIGEEVDFTRIVDSMTSISHKLRTIRSDSEQNESHMHVAKPPQQVELVVHDSSAREVFLAQRRASAAEQSAINAIAGREKLLGKLQAIEARYLNELHEMKLNAVDIHCDAEQSRHIAKLRGAKIRSLSLQVEKLHVQKADIFPTSVNSVSIQTEDLSRTHVASVAAQTESTASDLEDMDTHMENLKLWETIQSIVCRS